jgi:hypothetical protein
LLEIFFGVYGFILSDRFRKPFAAVLGATLVVGTGVDIMAFAAHLSASSGDSRKWNLRCIFPVADVGALTLS